MRMPRDIYASFVVYHGMLVYGMDSAFTAYFLIGQDNVTLEQESFIGSLNMCMSPVGSLLALFLTDQIGRKRTLQLTLVLYTIAWLFIASCTSISAILIAGRILSGVASGIQDISLIYVSEVCHPRRRGSLLALGNVIWSVGTGAPMIFAYYYHWRFIAQLSVFISVAGLIQMSSIPETKYWYLLKGQRKKAEESLTWFSKSATQEEISVELHNIEHTFLNQNQRKHSIWRMLQQSDSRKYFLLGMALHALQCGCGRIPIVTHLEHFFLAFHTIFDSKKLVLALGIVDFIVGFVFFFVSDKLKRTTLLYTTLALMSLALLGISLYDFLNRQFNVRVPLAPVILLFVYLVTCSPGLTTGVTMLVTEMICDENRGAILNLIHIIIFFTKAVYAFLLPFALEDVNIHLILLYFLLNTIAIGGLVKKFVPDTTGKALYQCVRDIQDNEYEKELLLSNG